MKLFRVTGIRAYRSRAVTGPSGTLHVGGIYSERAITPHVANDDGLISRELVGEGPPDFDAPQTIAELTDQCKALRNWINGPVATALRRGSRVRYVGPIEAARVAYESDNPGSVAAGGLALRKLRKVVDAAIVLGWTQPPRDTESLDKMGAIVVLNGILQWAAEGESEHTKPPAPPKLEAVWLGECKVCVGEATISLEPQFADVLQALAELRGDETAIAEGQRSR